MARNLAEFSIIRAASYHLLPTMPRRYKHLPLQPPKKIKPIPLTPAKHAQLLADETRLTQELAAAQERIKTAREMGDLSENGAYKYGKFEAGKLRRQLNQVTFLLEHGVVTAASGNTTTVQFGHTVTLQHLEKPETTKTFTLVSQHESDPAHQLLSLDSPIGQAVLGKKVGQEVGITTPRGTQRWKISSISS